MSKRIDIRSAAEKREAPRAIKRFGVRVAEYRKRTDAVVLDEHDIAFARDMAEQHGVPLERAVMALKCRRAASSMEGEMVSVFEAPREIPEPLTDTTDDTQAPLEQLHTAVDMVLADMANEDFEP